MDQTIKEELDEYGFVVVDQLLSPEECEEMKEAAYELCRKLTQETQNKIIFSTKKNEQLKEDSFLQSNDKIVPFIEAGALDENMEYVVDPIYSLNKIGHALHLLNPLFRFYTYCDRIKSICRMLGLIQPAVVQSMIIFKNPGVSSEVQPHQDGSFLCTEPIPPVGFWIPLEDATVENGCLWILRGSHKTGLHRQLKRNSDPNSDEKLVYDRPNPIYPASQFEPVPVKKGSCIILHGHVVHKSGINKTDKARPAYTFHAIEKRNNTYSPDNWLQEGPEAPFYDMYEVKQIVDENEEVEEEDAAALEIPVV